MTIGDAKTQSRGVFGRQAGGMTLFHIKRRIYIRQDNQLASGRPESNGSRLLQKA